MCKEFNLSSCVSCKTHFVKRKKQTNERRRVQHVPTHFMRDYFQSKFKVFVCLGKICRNVGLAKRINKTQR